MTNAGSHSLSDDALVLAMAYFPTTGSTLSFGGDGAEMAITKRGRAAVDELVAEGFIKPAEPWGSTPNREYYTTVKSALPLPSDRKHLNPWGPGPNEHTEWAIFEKRACA